jgi:hypothetical protein
MTINTVSIPLAVLENEQYMALPPRARDFMIKLYMMFDDCRTFTIDFDSPEQYGKAPGAQIAWMTAKLVDVGVIDIVARRPRCQRGPSQRVYAFRYSVLAEE